MRIFPAVYGVRSLAAAAVLLALLAGPAAFGQTIPNPSFEADTFTAFPGYILGNTAITGWTANQDDKAGINPGGGNPFADNGSVPDGNNVAFIQWSATGTTLSTTINGLTPGIAYKASFRANARGGNAPNLRISIDGQELMAATIHSVGANFPYWYGAFEFTAAAESQTLQLLNDAPFDNTVLVDDFKLAPSTGRWVVAAWTGDLDSGIDPQYFYTHAYNFGSSASPVINGVPFTGVPGGNPSVAGQFSTTTFANVIDNDPNNVGGDSATLAHTFVYGGDVPAGTFQIIALQGLTPGTEYMATIYTVAWEDPSLGSRWATFGVGEDRLTVNQDQFGNNNGLTVSYRYTADASGTISIKFAPFAPANVSFHVYGFSNRETANGDVPPVITAQPHGTTVADGTPVTFSVVANGLPAPSYQWRIDGAEIGGANSPTYTLNPASVFDAGGYDVVVSNFAGSVTSVVARLTVGLPMTNPSFEADSFGVWPGYVSGNFAITGWASLPNHGLNPVTDTRSPFADNGAIPNGNQVAFLQGDGAVSQVVGGFTPGGEYYVHYYENARNCCGGASPFVEVQVAGATVLAAHPVAAVLGNNPYHETFSDVFVAADTSLELDFIKSNPEAGDTTALIDNVAFVEIPAGTAPFIGRNPQPLLISVGDSASISAQGLGSLPLRYQWLKNGVAISGATNPTLNLTLVQKPAEADYSLSVSNAAGHVTSAAAHLTVYEAIPDLFNTGVDSNRQPVADGLADPHYVMILNPDTSSPDAIIEDSTVFPISDNTWLRDTAISKWIGPQLNTSGSAVGLYTYRTVIDLTDRNPETVVIEGQWATDNTGRDIQVNGVSTGNPLSSVFNAYTPFAIYGTNTHFVAGSNAIDFVVENTGSAGYTGLRVQIVRSNLEIPPGTPPEITTQPVSQRVAEGDTVTFTAEARGTSPLSYQWLKNGAPLAGQNSLTLTLIGVTNVDSGDYTISVSNAVNQVVSLPAHLCVCLRALPGVFGTGLDTDGSLLVGGGTDPHYILAVSPDGSYPGPDAFVVNDGYPIVSGTWLLNGPSSKWLAPWANQNNQSSTGGNAEGQYTYETAFDLSGYDLSQISVSGGWAVDNTGLDILVNGVSSGLTASSFASMTPFTLTALNGLVAGMNTLDFVVTNAPPTPNPTALRVDLRAYLNIEQTLSLSHNGTNGTITWTSAGEGQQLQWAPAISGPWKEIPGAGSPYDIGFTNGMRFYRVFTP